MCEENSGAFPLMLCGGEGGGGVEQVCGITLAVCDSLVPAIKDSCLKASSHAGNVLNVEVAHH